MSDFLNPSVSNPVSKWGEFKGKESVGAFKFWDKSQNEGEETSFEEEVIVMPLFIHSGVTGYSKKESKGIYSNEVKNISTDTLKVRMHGGDVIAEGIWKDIKLVVESQGGKFMNVMYGVRIFKNGENRAHELIAIKFSGIALGGWISANINAGHRKAVGLKKGELMTEGDNTFWSMSVKKYKQDAGLIEIAMPYAKELSEYFNYYFSDRVEEVIDSNITMIDAPNKLAIEGSSNKDMDADFAMAGSDFEDLPF